MPTNLLNADTGFPNLNRYNSSDEKIKAISDYLFMLLEQLRYQFGNMSVDNFSESSIKELANFITEPVYVQIQNEIGEINQLAIDAAGLYERLYNEETGDITTITATIEGLTVTDAGGTTYINGSMISTDSILANRLNLGGPLEVFTKMDPNAQGRAFGGYLGYISGSTGSGLSTTDGIGMMNNAETGQVLATSAGARMSYNNIADVVVADTGDISGYVALKAGDGTNKYSIYYSAITESGNDIYSFRPEYGANIYLGSQTYPWATAYLNSAVVVVSDRTRKHDIEYGLDGYDSFFDSLQPCRFRMNSEGNEGSYHVGLIAQDVEESICDSGLIDSDFAGLYTGDYYGLGYEEFIGLLIDQVQKLKARVTALEAEI